MKARPPRLTRADRVRGGRARTSAKAAAARANGAKGGRPRSAEGDDAEVDAGPDTIAARYERIAELGAPPGDILELCEWLASANAIALRETLLGRGSKRLNQELRAFSNTALRLIPAERLAELERLLKPSRSKRSKVNRARGVPLERVDESAPPSDRPRIRG